MHGKIMPSTNRVSLKVLQTAPGHGVQPRTVKAG
jgi:hypothetical protein